MDELREKIGRSVRDALTDATDIDLGDYASLKAADACLSAIKQAGFAVVPVEPTEAMESAGCAELVFGEPMPHDASRCWRAMIDANEVVDVQEEDRFST